MFFDDFDRANETPVAAPYGPLLAFSQYNLSSNHLVAAGNDAITLVDTAAAVTTEVDFTVTFNVSSGEGYGIIAGFSTSDNEYLRFVTQSGHWWVFHYSNTTYIETIADGAGGTSSGTVILKVVAIGDSYEFWSDNGTTNTLLWSGTVSTWSRVTSQFGAIVGTIVGFPSTTIESVGYVTSGGRTVWRDDFERVSIGDAPNGEPYDITGSWNLAIYGHPASTTSATSVVVFDAHKADVYVSAKTYGREITTDPWAGVVVRYQDANNYVCAVLRNDQTVRLVGVVGGVETEWAVSSDLGTTDDVIIQVQTEGNVYTLTVNGVEEATYTDTDDNFLTETRHGLFTHYGTASFDWLQVEETIRFADAAHVHLTPGTVVPPLFIDGAHVALHGGTATAVPPALTAGAHVRVHLGTAVPMEAPAQFFDVAPALRGPIAYGPAVGVEGAEPAPLTARLFRRSAPSIEIAELDQSFARQWQDQANEAGSGSLSLANDDDAIALLSGDDLIRFELHGYAAFSFLARERETVALSEGEEHDQITTLTGPGHVSILDEGVVYPPRGVETSPSGEDRIFSWPAPDYDDSAWGPVAELMAANEDPPENEGWWAATNFPDPTAQWIWAPGTTVAAAPEGHGYVRYVFEIFSAISAIAYVTVDNGGDFYVDGQLLIDQMKDFTTVHTAEFDLSIGDHTLAMIGHNAPPADMGTINPAGFICAVYEKLPSGDVGDLLFHTDSTWKGLWYPPVAPGMTPGEALRHAVVEAWARGTMLGVSLGFTDELDSDGNPWPLVGDIATKVGTDVLTFARELSDTYIDFAMAPGSFRLLAWVKGMRGETKDVALVAAEPDDAETGNLAALSFRAVY